MVFSKGHSLLCPSSNLENLRGNLFYYFLLFFEKNILKSSILHFYKNQNI